MHNHSIALEALLPCGNLAGDLYSQRIAAIGSICDARSAGKSEAALAMTVNAATDPPRTQGSRGDVP